MIVFLTFAIQITTRLLNIIYQQQESPKPHLDEQTKCHFINGRIDKNFIIIID